MKKYGYKQKLSLFIAIVLFVTSAPMSVVAVNSASEGISFEKSTFDYQVYATKDLFMDNCQSGDTATTPTQTTVVQSISISDLSVGGFGEDVVLELTIENQPLAFVGTLYPVVGGGYYDDKLVLGDFADSVAYNIVLFQISKAPDSSASSESSISSSAVSFKNILKLVLEKLGTGEVYSISMCMSDSQFTMFHEAALRYYESLEIEPNSDRYWEIATKTLSLWRFNNNWSSESVNAASSTRALSTFTYDSVSPQNVGQYIPKTNLKNFFIIMENFGWNNYSSTSLMGNALTQTGWRVYHNNISGGQYFYVTYGVAVGDGSYNVQIMYCTYSTANNGQLVATHLEVQGSAVVRYIPTDTTSNCTVIYFDAGPKLTEFYLCQSELAGDSTFFTDSYLTFSMYNNENPWAGFLISRIPRYGDLIVDIWDALSVSNASVSSWGQGYEKTLLAQIESGGLIKDICAQSKTASLRLVGNYLDLTGTISGTYSSHVVKFKFTAKSAI